MAKILVVEDDGVIRSQVAAALQAHGHVVIEHDGSQDPAALCRAEGPDLLVMDIGLSRKNGLYWCELIRRRSKLPILIVSARREDVDLITGMAVGADDYLAKPFALSVFVAKVQALLRRTYDYNTEPVHLTLGDLVFYPEEMRALGPLGQVDLSATEGAILAQLLRAAGGFVSREGLALNLWEGAHFIDDNTLSVNVSRLRKKLEGTGASVMIQTKKGYGYGIMEKD
ncbi:response regulator transcription factor [Peptococcus simiae]|uniref:Stage 0 sporulation protein A homolog n=1 Tax=Peptococcus simiae TaxID=1643805 RepID=A0ABW9GXT9_9FIRM